MKIILPADFENMPEWQVKMAVLHAQCYVEDDLGLDENHPKYEKNLQKAAIKYLKEGVEESLTPHAINPIKKAANRTTPIVEDAFQLQPYFSIDGPFFTSYIEDKEQREKFYRLLRSSVNTLAFIYVVAAMGLKKMSFAFLKGSSPEDTKQKVLNRYKRAFLVTSIMALLEPLFRTNPKSLDDYIEKMLEPHGGEINKQEFRENFLTNLRNQISKEGFSKASLDKILK